MSTTIVGGLLSNSNFGRYLVQISNSKGGSCSGVLIAPDAIITAAHCTLNPGSVDDDDVNFSCFFTRKTGGLPSPYDLPRRGS